MKTPARSWGEVPRFSPLMVTLVPGGPSLGEIPDTTGGGPMVDLIGHYLEQKSLQINTDASLKIITIKNLPGVVSKHSGTHG